MVDVDGGPEIITIWDGLTYADQCVIRACKLAFKDRAVSSTLLYPDFLLAPQNWKSVISVCECVYVCVFALPDSSHFKAS